MATINDIVLIHLEDAPVSFARVESILPDHKKDWYQIKLLMLQIPLQVVTWILKDAYINGDDFFMNGKKMRLEKVECPPDDAFPVMEEDPLENDHDPSSPQSPPDPASPKHSGNVISFSAAKTKKTGKKESDPEPDIG